MALPPWKLCWSHCSQSATYPLTVDPVLHDQAAKLTASDAQNDDRLGNSVAIGRGTICQ